MRQKLARDWAVVARLPYGETPEAHATEELRVPMISATFFFHGTTQLWLRHPHVVRELCSACSVLWRKFYCHHESKLVAFGIARVISFMVRGTDFSQPSFIVPRKEIHL